MTLYQRDYQVITYYGWNVVDVTGWAFIVIVIDMIYLFTDFGWNGPYVGQMKTVLATCEPDMAVIDLMHDVPVFDIRAGAYLLASLAPHLPQGAVVAGVVDPGVGSDRRALAIHADGRWYIGPDNGLFEIVMRRSKQVDCFEIGWCPAKLSASFHGRDLFAPVAAMLSRGDRPDFRSLDIAQITRDDWPDDWPCVIYVDRFGNLMTGVRAQQVSQHSKCDANGRHLTKLRTFSDAQKGQAFWYENALGLVEIAVNQGNASEILGLQGGAAVSFVLGLEA